MPYTELLNPLEFFRVIGGPLILMRQFLGSPWVGPGPQEGQTLITSLELSASLSLQPLGQKAGLEMKRHINDTPVMKFP